MSCKSVLWKALSVLKNASSYFIKKKMFIFSIAFADLKYNTLHQRLLYVETFFFNTLEYNWR